MRRLGVATRRTGWVRVAVGISGVVGLLWLVVVVAPPWFVDDDSLEGLKAQNEVRTTLLQGIAGVVLLVGGYFTYRQLHTAREGQITERYTRAIDQLGHPELDVRLGGIYALERIARDSPADRPTIGEVFTAFIRSHAPWPPRRPGQYAATAPIDEVPALRERAPDVQASLTVLGRSGFAPPARKGDRELDLTAVDLRRADLYGARLEKANFMRAHLEKADFTGARLGNANLMGAHLDGASFLAAHLEELNALGVHLEGASLASAHLENAILVDAHLEKASLFKARLEKAHLNSAHLEGADLRGAHFDGAILDGAHLNLDPPIDRV